MKIYVKTFNRPFYLDRCLRSIRFWCNGCDEVVVLDDGTLSKYRGELERRHPGVRWERSNADDGKFAMVREGRFDEIRRIYEDPGRFWMRVLAKDAPAQFVMLEDDTWFVDRVDLEEIGGIMRRRGIPIVKLWWGDPAMHPPSESVEAVELSWPTGLSLFQPRLSTPDDYWKVWLQCMAVYRIDWWMNAYDGIRDGVNDEHFQLTKVREKIAAEGCTSFARTARRVVYQGWAAPGRSDPKYARLGLAQHLLQDRLNDAWASGVLDSMEGVPYDYSASCILGTLEGYVPDEQLHAWRAWRRGDLGQGYENWYNDGGPDDGR